MAGQGGRQAQASGSDGGPFSWPPSHDTLHLAAAAGVAGLAALAWRLRGRWR